MAGDFTSIYTASNGDVNRQSIARLLPNGDWDAGFDLKLPTNSIVSALAVQPDGKSLVAGSVVTFDQPSRTLLSRFHADGSLDASFTPSDIVPNGIMAVAVQANGKIIIAGNDTSTLARLNADGSLDTSFDTTGTGVGSGVSRIVLQLDGKILIAGSFSEVNGIQRPGIARLNGDRGERLPVYLSFAKPNYEVGEDIGKATITVERVGDAAREASVDFTTSAGTAIPGKDYVDQSGTLTFAPLELEKTIIVPIIDNGARDVARTVHLTLSRPSGGVTFLPAATSVILTIHDDDRPGSVDANFSAPLVSRDEASGDGIIAFQSDGGVVTRSPNGNLIRLNRDGSADLSFKPDAMVNGIASIFIQPDDKILVSSVTATNAARVIIRRLNADGSLDVDFPPSQPITPVAGILGVQPDGKVIIARAVGDGGAGVRRLANDGSLDSSFFYPLPPHGQPQGVVLVDGRILLAHPDLVRLNLDGTKDTAFKPGSDLGPVLSFAVHDDGKIVVLKDENIPGKSLYSVVRLNPDGSRDQSFNSNVRASGGLLAPAPGGKTVLAGGAFTEGVIHRQALARINADGSLDTDFDPGTGLSSIQDSSWLAAVTVQPDGQALVAGRLISANGFQRIGILRFNSGVNHLKLSSPTRAADGTWNLEMRVRPGQAYVLEASSDLRAWVPLQTNTAASFTLGVVDPDHGQFGGRFYRAVRSP